MINIEEQQTLLMNVSRALKKKITVYAIGGTAMMLYGIKDSTKDIDLVFENFKDRGIFIKALESIDYERMNSVIVYGEKKNQPEMLTLENERFDLFLENVISFIFSGAMKVRARDTYEFGTNLIIKTADYHDLILMKCATDREKDKEDVKNIMDSKKVDWNIIVSEAKNQIQLGKEMAAFELGCFLEELKKTRKDIPKNILDELFNIVKKQAEEKEKIR